MLRVLVSLSMLVGISASRFALAQLPPPVPEPPPPIATTLADPSMAAASQARRTDESNLSRLFAGSPGLHSTGGPLDLLRYETIVKELELSPDQQRRLAAARVEMIRRRQSRTRQRRKARPETQAMAPRETSEVEAQLLEDQKLLSDVLSESQIARLSQLHLQWRIESVGTLAVLLDPQMAIELDLNDDDRSRLKQAANDAADEFKRKVLDLKREYEQRVMDELPSEAASRFDRLLGPKMNKR